MDRPLWDRIQEIYHSTLPMPHPERDAFVATACDDDPLLLKEVNSLLDADKLSDGFLESPVFEIGLKIISSNERITFDPAISTDSLIGIAIDDRYLIEKELGHGGIGKVYLARDLTLHNRPVVIKVLLEASLQDAYVVRKFKQEVEALARIDHPGVVSVLGAGALADGKPYIVMQYVSGVTLRSQISTEGMNLERVALILRQIGAALDDVHEKGIFHRDLKPENIMLQALRRGAELVKVVDFGIAKVKDSVIGPSTVNGVSVGTLLYISPEQLRGGERITAASDIYSMGVIAYEMITGRRPFNPVSGPQLLEMHRAGVRVRPIDLRPSLSTEAQAIMLRALSFEPSARYQSAMEFGDSLAHTLMGEENRPIQQSERLSREPAHSIDLNAPATIEQAINQSPTPLMNSDALSGSLSRASRRLRLGIIGVLLIILTSVGLLGVYKYLGRNDPPSPSSPSRSFTYWLTVQKMRGGKRYQEPFQSSGQEIFETGYKFRLNVNSPDPGYLYLFSEGPTDPDGISFTIVYPTPATNNGSATVGPNQSVATNWNTFEGPAGTEDFWIVWAAAPVNELEFAKTEAFKHPKGALSDKNLIAVKEFLKAKQSEVKLRTSKDRVSQMTTVRGAGDVLVRLTEFEHK